MSNLPFLQGLDCQQLADFLAANQVLGQPLPAVLDALAKVLTSEFERFRNLPASQRRLTVALAGFGPPGPFAAAVTNQEDEQGRVLAEPEDRFRVSMSLRNEKEMKRLDMILHGAEAAIDEDLTRVIAKIQFQHVLDMVVHSGTYTASSSTVASCISFSPARPGTSLTHSDRKYR